MEEDIIADIIFALALMFFALSPIIAIVIKVLCVLKEVL